MYIRKRIFKGAEKESLFLWGARWKLISLNSLSNYHIINANSILPNVNLSGQLQF